MVPAKGLIEKRGESCLDCQNNKHGKGNRKTAKEGCQNAGFDWNQRYSCELAVTEFQSQMWKHVSACGVCVPVHTHAPQLRPLRTCRGSEGSGAVSRPGTSCRSAGKNAGFQRLGQLQGRSRRSTRQALRRLAVPKNTKVGLKGSCWSHRNKE